MSGKAARRKAPPSGKPGSDWRLLVALAVLYGVLVSIVDLSSCRSAELASHRTAAAAAARARRPLPAQPPSPCLRLPLPIAQYGVTTHFFAAVPDPLPADADPLLFSEGRAFQHLDVLATQTGHRQVAAGAAERVGWGGMRAASGRAGQGKMRRLAAALCRAVNSAEALALRPDRPVGGVGGRGGRRAVPAAAGAGAGRPGGTDPARPDGPGGARVGARTRCSGMAASCLAAPPLCVCSRSAGRGPLLSHQRLPCGPLLAYLPGVGWRDDARVQL